VFPKTNDTSKAAVACSRPRQTAIEQQRRDSIAPVVSLLGDNQTDQPG